MNAHALRSLRVCVCVYKFKAVTKIKKEEEDAIDKNERIVCDNK